MHERLRDQACRAQSDRLSVGVCAFRSPLGTYRLVMPRFLKLWLYARAFVTRYPGFLRLRGSPCFSLALYGIICTGFMMLCFYTTRANFAILPHPNKACLQIPGVWR